MGTSSRSPSSSPLSIHPLPDGNVSILSLNSVSAAPITPLTTQLPLGKPTILRRSPRLNPTPTETPTTTKVGSSIPMPNDDSHGMDLESSSAHDLAVESEDDSPIQATPHRILPDSQLWNIIDLIREATSISDSRILVDRLVNNLATLGITRDTPPGPPTVETLSRDVRDLHVIISEISRRGSRPEPCPATFSSIVSQLSGKRPRPSTPPTSPAPASSSPAPRPKARNPFASSDGNPKPLSESDRLRALGQASPTDHDGPLTAVFLYGLHKPIDVGAKFISNYLQSEHAFPSDLIRNVCVVANGLSELVLPLSAVPRLQQAVQGSTLEISTTFDPCTPLSPNMTSKMATNKFHARIDSQLSRLKTSAPPSRRCTALVQFFSAYKASGVHTPVIAPVQSRSDFLKNAFMNPAQSPVATSNAPKSPAPICPATSALATDMLVDSDETPVGPSPIQGTDQ